MRPAIGPDGTSLRILRCVQCHQWVKVRSILVLASSCELAGSAAAPADPTLAENQGTPVGVDQGPVCLFECRSGVAE